MSRSEDEKEPRDRCSSAALTSASNRSSSLRTPRMVAVYRQTASKRR